MRKGCKAPLLAIVVACIGSATASGAAEDGKALSERYCAGCHQAPTPDLLPRDIWRDHVLPDMGARLGITSFKGRFYNADPTAPAGFYAETPVLSESEWATLNAYFLDNASEVLPRPDRHTFEVSSRFALEVPNDTRDFPAVTAIHIDEANGRLLIGDAYESDLEVFDEGLHKIAEVRTGGVISRIRNGSADRYLATVIGENIGQTQQLHGLVVEVAPGFAPGEAADLTRLLRRLHRPVDFLADDFNGDGVEDVVVAQFGTHEGRLSGHLSQTDGSMASKTLIFEAGATSLAIYGDDLYALMAQGNERIVRFSGFGQNGTGDAQTVLNFPPSYGSSQIKVTDFNGDGQADILYVAGDNADISPVLKPYHGIYLYLGRPDGGFEKDMFFHFDGAYGAVVEDFDNDGDKDIAAVSYFDDYERAPDSAGFVYLENTDAGFLPFMIEGLGTLGRYVAIAAGDLDGDGDKDIALANLAFGAYGPLEVSEEMQANWLNGPVFVLLRNQTVITTRKGASKRSAQSPIVVEDVQAISPDQKGESGK